MALRTSREPERLTIYLGGEKRRKLLDFARRLTKASSDSEAIFSALQILRDEAMSKYKLERSKAFAKARGKWANIPNIGKILADVEKGWEPWNREIF